MIMVETMVQKLIGLEERCTYLAYMLLLLDNAFNMCVADVIWCNNSSTSYRICTYVCTA